jgi:hypothetical protein
MCVCVCVLCVCVCVCVRVHVCVCVCRNVGRSPENTVCDVYSSLYLLFSSNQTDLHVS